MFDNTNPYILRTEIAAGITRYYVSFADGEATLRETEISREVYLAMEECRKHEKRQRNFFDRYIEHSDLADETLRHRALFSPEPIEETIINNETADALRAAVARLPKVQRRRFILYHETGLTYEQISKMEGCTKMPIKRSIDRAEEKIREELKNFKK
jgi:RNA polymerase sigma-70 factor (ECF subfamily)